MVYNTCETNALLIFHLFLSLSRAAITRHDTAEWWDGPSVQPVVTPWPPIEWTNSFLAYYPHSIIILCDLSCTVFFFHHSDVV